MITAEPPPEFLCPISGTLMADPVVVPDRGSFERSIIQACVALSFSPPPLNLSSFSTSSPLVLLPNVPLKTEILNWCDSFRLPHPHPLPAESALHFVRRLMSSPSHVPHRPLQPQPQPAENPFHDAADILLLLHSPDAARQEEAAAVIRQETRESPERRKSLCTQEILSALRQMLFSNSDAVQVNAAAAILNLSLEAENKVKIVRSGAVSPIVDVLKSGHPEARDIAAGALYSLATVEENRPVILALGAIPPLIDLFACSDADNRARREAGMALYHISLTSANRSKIARMQNAVRALLGVASATSTRSVETEAGVILKLAIMVVSNLAACNEGRAALMDGGAVEAVVRLMQERVAAPRTVEEEHCLVMLYEMSRGNLRFRGLARAAGVENVLIPMAEGDGGDGGMRRNIARKILRAMKGEDDASSSQTGDILPAFSEYAGSISTVSDGLRSLQGRPRDYGAGAGAGRYAGNMTGPKSTAF